MDKNKENKTSLLKKITTICGCILTIVVLIFAVVVCVKAINNNHNQSMHERLSQVTNVSYNEITNLLTWNTVEHADMYKVDVNGKQNNVETNSYTFMPTSKVSNIKVQAIDTSGVYDISKWSDTFTYTIPEDKITTQKVFAFVDGLDESSKVVSIASMYLENNQLQTKCHVISFEGTDKVVSYETNFVSPVNSLNDVLNTKVLGTDILREQDYSKYDSAKYYIESNEYTGKMEEYRQQGYKFEVVSSTVADRGDKVFTIYGTYKLTKDNDVKYITSSLGCGILDSKASKSASYTTKLKDISNRNVREIECHELTGDFYDWANMTYESNQARKNAQINTKSVSKIDF